MLPNYVFFHSGSPIPAPAHVKFTVAHEYAHIWDWTTGYYISVRMRIRVKPIIFCTDTPVAFICIREQWRELPLTDYAYKNAKEDWAETVAAFIYPEYVANFIPGGRDIRDSDASIRRQFVVDEINSIR